MTNDQITGPCPECEKLRTKLAEAEAYPIKCIWCGLKISTVDEAAEHVVGCVKSPNHPLTELLRLTESRAEAAEAKLEIAINATAPQVDAMLAAKLEAAEAERDSLQMQVVSHQNRIAELESYNHGIAETQDRLQAEVARLKEELEAEQKVHSDAATNAFDEIAAICGCPEWHYPGQIVRDVLALRDQLRARISELEAGLREIVRLPFECLDDCKDIAHRLLDGRGE